jgi:hypothetical protein
MKDSFETDVAMAVLGLSAAAFFGLVAILILPLLIQF